MALASVRGTFPNFERSIYPALAAPVRNATITTIAPTGSLSIIAGCSSGVEPLFAVSFVKTVVEGTKLIEVNPYFEEIAKERGFYSVDLMGRIAEEGSIQHIDEIPEDVKRIFVTAHDITPADHVHMQAAFQKYVDNAVSKTVNFPHAATKEDVREVYMLAYQTGCKGVTVYRDGSRDNQVLTTGKNGKAVAAEAPALEDDFPKVTPRKRPSDLQGRTKKLTTGCGHIYVTVNGDQEKRPFELFTSIGKAGGCASSQAAALGRLISLSLRCGVKPEEVVSQLKGISCQERSFDAGGTVYSCPDAIAKALDWYLDVAMNGNGNGSCPVHQVEAAPHKLNTEAMHIGACPNCGGTVEHEGGCAVCHSCGWDRCA